MIILRKYLKKLEEGDDDGAVVTLYLPEAAVEQADAEPVLHRPLRRLEPGLSRLADSLQAAFCPENKIYRAKCHIDRLTIPLPVVAPNSFLYSCRLSFSDMAVSKISCASLNPSSSSSSSSWTSLLCTSITFTTLHYSYRLVNQDFTQMFDGGREFSVNQPICYTLGWGSRD